MKQHNFLFALFIFLAGSFLYAQESADSTISSAVQYKPVNPNATAEAVELLDYLYSISGKHTLSGQHSEPLFGSIKLAVVEKAEGKYPAVFGQDFGFSEPGTWDGINYRQQIVDEAIKRHNEGFIITLMWHAVRPTEEEPVRFKESIQGDLTDEEWNDLITEGTLINAKWKSQVDVIAFFLKQLQYADVPVIWRPYHEMNGGWFWWGAKYGEDGYKKLYRMLYDRLTNFHHINNLIWVFNANELGEGKDPYEMFYPGHDYVDILATDVYGSKFADSVYTQLVDLAEGRPVAIGEVGDLPTLDILEKQPNWVWYMRWFDRNNYESKEHYEALNKMFNSERVLNWDELPWTQKNKPKIHFPILK